MTGRHVGWWIGDWLRYGNATYGERYARAAKITGYDAQTLMNMVYVASQVEASRRRESLSWSHHAEVAALPEAEQEWWLADAEARRLSVRDLREEVRRARRQSRPESADDRRERCDEPDPLADERSGLAADGGAAMKGAADAVTCPGCGHEFLIGTPQIGLDAPARHLRLVAPHDRGEAT
jgi:hypothetical protein